MNAGTWKMFLRSIRNSLGRFLAILAIVALGVGFYAGLKSSQPDMLRSADDYLHRTKMYDFQLLSSLGLSKNDPSELKKIPGIEEAEGACFADAYARAADGAEEVWHFQTLTERVAVPELLAGRLPANDGECLVDSRAFREEDLGSRIVLTDSNSEDILEHFAHTAFTVVGLASSPRYISDNRGTSELGSGKPAGFVLLPASAFTDDAYHEILLWCDLPGTIYSEEYSDALRHMRPAVETMLNRRSVLRARQLREENSEALIKARKELDDGWSEYRLGLQTSAQELADGKQQLEAAELQLEVGRAALEQSEKLLAEQEGELENLRKSKQEKQAELNSLLDLQKTALSDLLTAQLQLEAHKAALAAQQIQLPDIPESITLDPAVTDALSRLGIDIDLSEINNELSNIQDALEQAGNSAAGINIDEEEAALSRQQEDYLDLVKKIASLELELTALETEISAFDSILSESMDEIDDAKAELAEGELQLQAGWEEYNAGKEKADSELAEARQKLEDAEKELADGEAELDEILQPQLFTLDRTSNPGYVTFENDTAIVDGIAAIFPVFFVLVAALVCITTMTRMVNEERTQIGTLKAMGYSSPVIMSKYLLYAGLSALLGCLLGFVLGSVGLPYLVWYAYNIIYQYSGLLFHYSGRMLAACLLVSVVGSLFVTWLACRTVLAEKPAELVRPKAPSAGKRVFLERLGPLWRRLPFLSKVSIRNAFRYPSRLFMILLGIGGCTALMVAGFGVRDSLGGVGGYQYDEISLYDIVVTLAPDSADTAPEALWDDWAEHAALTHKEEIRLLNGSGAGKDTDLILADAADIAPLLSLHDRKGTEFSWPAPGEVIITQKLSEVLDLHAGDSAVLRLESGKERAVTVSAVCEYYIGHAVFASPSGYPDTERNNALIRVKEGEDIALRAAKLRNADSVSYVSLTETERETLENSIKSIDLLVMMLIGCSGALAFITLYNLTNINILERIREVATVKVLGFTPRETAEYILNENLMLSFLGAILGLLLGKLLHRFVMVSINLDYMSYDIRIDTLSYALSFVNTFVFACLTNLFMRRKLAKVSMAESLKSVE